jgi:Zn-dependent peptidase ImmA (M78 family)
MVGVSQPAIQQIEATGNIADANLAAIAKATDFAAWWFRLGPLPDLPDGSMKFRKRANATKRDEERIRAYARQTIEAVDRLSKPFYLPAVLVRSADGHVGSLSPNDIETWATTARSWLSVGSADRIPNLTKAVERAGVFVLPFAHELDRHDGVSFWPEYPIGRPFIFYHRGHSGDRQRFSIAHELGHLCLHQMRNVDPRVAEDEANAFAGALLAPREGVMEDLSDGVTLRTLAYTKATWGISIRALIRRSLDLGVIDAEKRVSLEKQYSSRGWAKEEPVAIPEEHAGLLKKLVEANQGPLTTGGVRQALGVPSMASRELVA